MNFHALKLKSADLFRFHHKVLLILTQIILDERLGKRARNSFKTKPMAWFALGQNMLFSRFEFQMVDPSGIALEDWVLEKQKNVMRPFKQVAERVFASLEEKCGAFMIFSRF